MNRIRALAFAALALSIASIVWAELRLVGRLWANDGLQFLIGALSSELVFEVAIRALAISALFVLPTYLLLKGSIEDLAAAGAFIWLGVALSTGNLLVFEFTHVVVAPGLWLLADPLAGAIAGFVAWSLFYRFGVWRTL